MYQSSNCYARATTLIRCVRPHPQADSSLCFLRCMAQRLQSLVRKPILLSEWPHLSRREPHYLAKYTICDPARENLRREILGNDWRALFLYCLRQAIGALDLKISERSGRAELARQVALTM